MFEWSDTDAGYGAEVHRLRNRPHLDKLKNGQLSPYPLLVNCSSNWPRGDVRRRTQEHAGPGRATLAATAACELKWQKARVGNLPAQARYVRLAVALASGGSGQRAGGYPPPSGVRHGRRCSTRTAARVLVPGAPPPRRSPAVHAAR